MQMRSAIQIQSMVKAMMDVVLPAVDPANKLAQEQARLVIGMLSMMGKQLPLQAEFDFEDLAELLRFSRKLSEMVSPTGAVKDALAVLASEVKEAATIYERQRIPPDAVVGMIHRVRAAVCSLLAAVSASGISADVERLERATLQYSKAQLLRDRAWVVMQGFEPNPQSVPSIESLLAIPERSAESIR